ncbi:MAG: ATP-dependent RecD-like DNA helicase [Deltaproteobacteria bacterium]|jgi:exodeoxyribonuclease V alpha subunit|nr:ATP-dependent RecD-like DNA helicase [Deltaproteobacteria bacterium]
MLTELSGQIERITFTNEDNGYTIAKVKVRGKKELVTVVGNLMAPMPGEILDMRGEWTIHPKFGEQFKVSQFKTKVPATVHGIQKYLGSGLIKGLGPVMAGRIVERFGEKTLDVIENQIGRLADVKGIGKKSLANIAKAWEAQKEIRDVMIFLQSHGVSATYATKIFKRYGDRSIAVVKQNPYRLATDIFGIGFLKADNIAKELGFSNDAGVRVEAGVVYALDQLSEDGHVFFPCEPLIERCREILNVEREPIVAAIGRLHADKQIVIEDINENIEDFTENNKAVYLTRYYQCETGIANRLRALLSTPKSMRAVDSTRAIQWVQDQLSFQPAEKQREAIRSALENKVLVLTGGPGTGKTTIIKAILKIFLQMRVEIMLAAPTGRAAKRMSEMTGHPAKTIHRLLEYSIHKLGFQRHEKNPLECDVLIVDETSMIDTVLMYHLLKAVPATASCIFVGDVNQLPSVGPGNVLKDLIASGAVTVIELTEIFRQAKTSRIIVNAHKINAGKLPIINQSEISDPQNDFYFIEQEDPQKVLDIILELAHRRISQRFGFDAIDDIQVLTPMHKGIVGAVNLNNQLQMVLNPGSGGIVRGDRTFRVNDKVMQIRNNYDKEVFNGDIGRISAIQPDERRITACFDSRQVVYDIGELDEMVLAYAVSVHKSQGSEYPVVILPILTQHYILLQRNLIYTAVTRGRHLVVMVGSRRALAIGVNNNQIQQRFTRLRHRLSPSGQVRIPPV